MLHEGTDLVVCPVCDASIPGTYETLYATTPDGLIGCVCCGEFFTVVKRDDAYFLATPDEFEFEDDEDDREDNDEEEEKKCFPAIEDEEDEEGEEEYTGN